MLKRLFTSRARIKLLQTFLLNPEDEFFIRELTRKLDEQINSIRRELGNLKKLGLLKSKAKNRKKYYIANKNFVLFNELKNIVLKAGSGSDELVKKLLKLGKIDVLVLSGLFIGKDTQADILAVGKIDAQVLQDFLALEVKAERPLRFSILSREDFLYRWKMHDKFVRDMIQSPENIVGINKLEPHLI